MATFGNITSPISKFDGVQGFFDFLSLIFKIAGIVAGLFFIFKIVMAGYGYLSASGDEKKTAAAWNTIWQSVLGLIIVASAFVLAGVIGYIFGINILNPTF